MSSINGSDLKDKMSELGAEVAQFAHEAGEKVGKFTTDMNAQSEDYVKSGKKFVKENPVQSALIAGVVGLVIGSLLIMMFKKNKN